MVGISLIAAAGEGWAGQSAAGLAGLPAPDLLTTFMGGAPALPMSTQSLGQPAAPRLIPGSIFALISTAGVATAYSLDHRVWHALSDSSGGATHRAGDLVSRLGDLRYLGSALVAGYAYGKLASLPGASSASARIGASVLGAAAVCGVAKIATGRARPDHAPGDSDDFSPFSGADAFPSGHTAVAFAFASALDQETSARWIPWVAYPAAAAVGWSRIADNRHWLSDVVAGAALGTWAGREFDLRLQKRAHFRAGVSASPIFRVSQRRARVGLAVRF